MFVQKSFWSLLYSTLSLPQTGLYCAVVGHWPIHAKKAGVAVVVVNGDDVDVGNVWPKLLLGICWPPKFPFPLFGWPPCWESKPFWLGNCGCCWAPKLLKFGCWPKPPPWFWFCPNWFGNCCWKLPNCGNASVTPIDKTAENETKFFFSEMSRRKFEEITDFYPRQNKLNSSFDPLFFMLKLISWTRCASFDF